MKLQTPQARLAFVKETDKAFRRAVQLTSNTLAWIHGEFTPAEILKVGLTSDIKTLEGDGLWNAHKKFQPLAACVGFAAPDLPPKFPDPKAKKGSEWMDKTADSLFETLKGLANSSFQMEEFPELRHYLSLEKFYHGDVPYGTSGGGAEVMRDLLQRATLYNAMRERGYTLPQFWAMMDLRDAVSEFPLPLNLARMPSEAARAGIADPITCSILNAVIKVRKGAWEREELIARATK